MRIRLNRLPWVAILLSTIWLWASGFYFWSDSVLTNGEHYRSELNGCYKLFVGNAVDPSRMPQDRLSTFAECKNRAIANTASQDDLIPRSFLIFLTIDLCFVILAWAVVWAIFTLGRRKNHGIA
jgi:hypothetical protein